MLSPDLAAYCSSSSGRAARRGGGTGAGGLPRSTDENGHAMASFVYPHGATLAVQAPAVAFLSSGQVAHPYNMAIGVAQWGGTPRAWARGMHTEGHVLVWQSGVVDCRQRQSHVLPSRCLLPGRWRLVAGERRPAGGAGIGSHV